MQARKLPSQQRGFVILFFVLSSIALFPIVGLSIDVVLMYFIKARLVSSADAGALAGARALSRGGDFTAQAASAKATAEKFFHSNFPNGALLTVATGPTLNVNVEELQDRTRKVTLEASVTAPVYFMRMINYTKANTNVRAIGQTTRRDVNIMLVVDRTGSLENVGACGTVKAAVIDFTNLFAEGRDLLGLATFAVASRVDVPLSNTNFKVNVKNIMTSVTCTGYTGGPQGLAMGRSEIARISDPGVLNVVLFFTDGIPNTITADWPVKKGPYYSSGLSTCTDKADKRGSITEQPTGVLKYQATAARDPSGYITGSSGCYYANGYSPFNDISFIPNTDIYGATLGSGWGGTLSRYGTTHQSYNYPPVGTKIRLTTTNVTLAAQNGVDNAAMQIKNMAGLKTVVYAIGFGPDAQEGLLMKVANDPRSQFYDSSKMAGLYLFAPTKDAIKEAFRRVSSEILRISI